MSYLVANVPPIKCFVRKEYLYDFQSGHGEYEPCYWVSVKSIRGKALYIEAYLPAYGAAYDKLPISAYVWKQDIELAKLLPLDHLQIWDAFSYNISVVTKDLLCGMKAYVYMKDKVMHPGSYLFTIDSCHSDPNELDVSLSETPDEHKSFNIIKLDNGQFAAQPNNRLLFVDQSFCPPKAEMKRPDFNVSTREFFCEDGDKWAAGNDDKFFYEIDNNI